MIATDGAIELGIHPHPSLLTSSTCHSLHRLVFSFLSLFLLSFISFLHFFRFHSYQRLLHSLSFRLGYPRLAPLNAAFFHFLLLLLLTFIFLSLSLSSLSSFSSSFFSFLPGPAVGWMFRGYFQTRRVPGIGPLPAPPTSRRPTMNSAGAGGRCNGGRGRQRGSASTPVSISFHSSPFHGHMY